MPIEYLPGVKPTLGQLKERHRLILFTKGDLSEQRDKVERSGAMPFFHHVEVTSDKSPSDYERLIEHQELSVEASWMVGNSPRSDINPALEVGLGAVFIPHPRTWELEHEEVRQKKGARYKLLQRFSDLLDVKFR